MGRASGFHTRSSKSSVIVMQTSQEPHPPHSSHVRGAGRQAKEETRPEAPQQEALCELVLKPQVLVRRPRITPFGLARLPKCGEPQFLALLASLVFQPVPWA